MKPSKNRTPSPIKRTCDRSPASPSPSPRVAAIAQSHEDRLRAALKERAEGQAKRFGWIVY